MNSPASAWKRDRHGRMEAARSLLRSSLAPSRRGSNGSASETAMWASPSAARGRSRPSNLHSAVRSSATFPLSRRDASSPLRTTVERVTTSKPTVQSRTTQATQTEDTATEKGIHLGAFGEVGTMAAETVDFLIRVLEDRKQELLKDTEIRVKVNYDEEDEDNTSEETKIARLQLDSTSNGGAGVTELVRSHSYEALVQLEGILEARHNQLMSNRLLETADGDS